MPEHAAVAWTGSGAVAEADTRKAVLGRVYSLLLQLAAESKSATSEPLETNTTADQHQKDKADRG